MTPDILSEDNPFIIKESRLSIAYEKPFTLQGGAVALCERGHATLVINGTPYEFSPGSEANIFTGMTLYIPEHSDDFKTLLFYCSQDMLEMAQWKFESFFFNDLSSHPVHKHSKETGNATRACFTMIEACYSEDNRYKRIIVTNLLRNLLLSAYDKIQRNVNEPKKEQTKTRKEELYDKFIEKVAKHCIHHHDVEYYAGRLDISPRYLGTITREIDGQSPKDIIDTYIVQEIKSLLSFSDMTLQQIADQLRFPDQSYLGRYFKRLAGKSPLEYRKGGLSM